MYVSYVTNNNVWVAQLASDAKSEVKSQQVYVPPSSIGEYITCPFPVLLTNFALT
jgi:hypothetical protein